MDSGQSGRGVGADSVMPVVPHASGNIGGGVPSHGDIPTNQMAGTINLPSDPQIRASRDAPAQVALMGMTGGPPDMSIMNMYQDDILNLVYRQFHVGQATIQGGASLGSIVLRLPYGLNLLSVYAQNWARLHKRYNGRIRVTFSVSAVPMIRGNLLLGVVRNMPADSVTTMTPQALQKIDWTVFNVNGSGEYELNIGDARKTNFYRDVSEDPISGPPSDLEDRPGIIGIVYTPLVNQFGEGSDNSVVINIRSAAISPLEDPMYGFKAWEPIDATVTTRSFEDSPQLIYAKDIFPTIANRSLYLDGTKVRTTDVHNIQSAAFPKGLFHGVRRAGLNTTPQQPFWFGEQQGDAPKRFMISLVEMDPLHFQWGTNSYPLFTGEIYQFMSDIGNGTIITPNPDNSFLGTVSGVEDINVTNLRAVSNAAGADSTNRIRITEVLIANYARGRILFVFGQTQDPAWPYLIDSLIPVEGVNGIHTVIWPLGSDSPTTTNSLPTGYYNVVSATDGQNQYLATLSGSPVLYPDYFFTQTFLSLRDRMLGPGESITFDLLDTRNNTVVGILFTLDDQVVIRTAVPNNVSSHYRFNVDLQYMGFANPRRSFGQPVSDSSRYLTPLDLTRGTSKYDVARALRMLDREFVDQLFAMELGGPARPNAMMAGMAAAGLVSGLGQGAMSWLAAKNDFNNKKSLQDDFFQEKFQTSWDLNLQNFKLQQMARGMQNFQAQPGAMAANSSSAQNAQLAIQGRAPRGQRTAPPPMPADYARFVAGQPDPNSSLGRVGMQRVRLGRQSRIHSSFYVKGGPDNWLSTDYNPPSDRVDDTHDWGRDTDPPNPTVLAAQT